MNISGSLCIFRIREASFFDLLLDAVSGGATQLLTALHVSPVVISLVVDGVIAGVGGILTFLPNIFVLFVALALLEDSG